MRVKRGVMVRKTHKKILKQAKGYYGAKRRQIRRAKEQLLHSLSYAYRDRRTNKRNARSLWIVRINAGARENEMTYGQFMSALKKANIEMNRKVLADMAVNDPASFRQLVQQVKKAS